MAALMFSRPFVAVLNEAIVPAGLFVVCVLARHMNFHVQQSYMYMFSRVTCTCTPELHVHELQSYMYMYSRVTCTQHVT